MSKASTYEHVPVLLAEVMAGIQLQPGDDAIDGTLGGGGYAIAMLTAVAPKGKVLGIDFDDAALQATQRRLKKEYADSAKRFVGVQGNFADMAELAQAAGFDQVAGIVLDLGLSSAQLDDKERGFSFDAMGFDMRFSQTGDLTAAQILRRRSVDQLTDIFREYGEEPLARLIAQKIVAARSNEDITPQQLVDITTSVYRKRYHHTSRINPATKVFQALRIVVNDEMRNLERVLPAAMSLLKPGGRLAVVSYHSLEDRIVKNFFRNESKDCICPPERPTCQCEHVAGLEIVTKKPIRASLEEIAVNHRSRSASLRIAQKSQKIKNKK